MEYKQCTKCFGYGHMGKPLMNNCEKCGGLGSIEIKNRKPQSHEEADLHLSVCNQLKKLYPDMLFIRHERERQRSKFSGQLMGKYNTIGGVPDFEIIHPIGDYHGMYIEFKKPGETWENKGVVKSAYAHQYNCHTKLWAVNKPVYFCNNYDMALELIGRYIENNPYPKQELSYNPKDAPKYSDVQVDIFW